MVSPGPLGVAGAPPPVFGLNVLTPWWPLSGVTTPATSPAWPPTPGVKPNWSEQTPSPPPPPPAATAKTHAGAAPLSKLVGRPSAAAVVEHSGMPGVHDPLSVVDRHTAEAPPPLPASFPPGPPWAYPVPPGFESAEPLCVPSPLRALATFGPAAPRRPVSLRKYTKSPWAFFGGAVSVPTIVSPRRPQRPCRRPSSRPSRRWRRSSRNSRSGWTSAAARTRPCWATPWRSSWCSSSRAAH